MNQEHEVGFKLLYWDFNKVLKSGRDEEELGT